jgi:predicted lactoylglutathione lyase
MIDTYSNCTVMLNHVTLHASDWEKSKEFYAKALAPLGYENTGDHEEWKLSGFGVGGKSDLWVIADGAKQEVHYAFTAANKEQVDEFYAAGVANGGTDNGAPGYRKDYTPGYYAAFVKDSDGHNIEVVFVDPNPSE